MYFDFFCFVLLDYFFSFEVSQEVGASTGVLGSGEASSSGSGEGSHEYSLVLELEGTWEGPGCSSKIREEVGVRSRAPRVGDKSRSKKKCYYCNSILTRPWWRHHNELEW